MCNIINFLFSRLEIWNVSFSFSLYLSLLYHFIKITYIFYYYYCLLLLKYIALRNIFLRQNHFDRQIYCVSLIFIKKTKSFELHEARYRFSLYKSIGRTSAFYLRPTICLPRDEMQRGLHCLTGCTQVHLVIRAFPERKNFSDVKRIMKRERVVLSPGGGREGNPGRLRDLYFFAFPSNRSL